MTSIADEARRFALARTAAERRASAAAAFFLSIGEDLDHALSLPPEARMRLCRRLERRIERERLRGAARHWSYDLNRHIALKQALEMLGGSATARRDPETKNGAQRRRHRRRSMERP